MSGDTRLMVAGSLGESRLRLLQKIIYLGSISITRENASTSTSWDDGRISREDVVFVLVKVGITLRLGYLGEICSWLDVGWKCSRK